MKLVQLLAKELKEWPKGVGKVMQDFDMEIRFFDLSGDQMTLLDFYIDELASDACDEIIFSGGGVEITKSQWQAEREKMNKPKWIRHRGGNQPVDSGITVEYRMRDSGVASRPELASDLRWDHRGSGGDIMAYRVIEETKDQEIEEVETIDTAKAPTIEYAFGDKDSDPKDLDWKQLGTLTSKLEIDATEATQRIDSLVAKWGQIESPLKWRDEIIELEAYEEEFRREREKLIRKLESEGFKLIDHVEPVYGVSDVDMSDWRNWQAGDIVECVTDDYAGVYTNGKHYVVELVKEDVFSVFDDCGKGSSCDWFGCESEGLKFIRRP